MDSTPTDDENGATGQPHDSYEIVLISFNQRYWLFKGEAHIKLLLSNGEYPKPVGCLVFENHATFADYLPDDVDLGDLWMINPLIVNRLRENEEMVEITP